MLGQFILTIAALVFSGLVSSGKTGRANIGAFALKPVPEDFFGALSGAAERRPDLNVRFCLKEFWALSLVAKRTSRLRVELQSLSLSRPTVTSIIPGQFLNQTIT